MSQPQCIRKNTHFEQFTCEALTGLLPSKQQERVMEKHISAITLIVCYQGRAEKLLTPTANPPWLHPDWDQDVGEAVQARVAFPEGCLFVPRDRKR